MLTVPVAMGRSWCRDGTTKPKRTSRRSSVAKAISPKEQHPPSQADTASKRRKNTKLTRNHRGCESGLIRTRTLYTYFYRERWGIALRLRSTLCHNGEGRQEVHETRGCTAQAFQAAVIIGKASLGHDNVGYWGRTSGIVGPRYLIGSGRLERLASLVCTHLPSDLCETGTGSSAQQATHSRLTARHTRPKGLGQLVRGDVSGRLTSQRVERSPPNHALGRIRRCERRPARHARQCLVEGPGLPRDTLHQHVQPRVANPSRVQSGVPHQLVNLTGRTLTATLTVDEHVEVHHRSDRARPVRVLVLVDREHSRASRHRRPHTGQNVAARSVAPIVKNPLHDVHVGAHIELAEQIAGTPLDPLRQSLRAQEALSLGEHLG